MQKSISGVFETRRASAGRECQSMTATISSGHLLLLLCQAYIRSEDFTYQVQISAQTLEFNSMSLRHRDYRRQCTQAYYALRRLARNGRGIFSKIA